MARTHSRVINNYILYGKIKTINYYHLNKYVFCRYLFLDWNFRHISNNKLKVTVDPDFNHWLNDTNTAKQLILNPKDLKLTFLKWLQLCHSLFDKERKFENRLLALEEKYSKDRGYKVCCFGRLSIDFDGKQHRIDANDTIYQLSEDCSSRRASAKVDYGKIKV